MGPGDHTVAFVVVVIGGLWQLLGRGACGAAGGPWCAASHSFSPGRREASIYVLMFRAAVRARPARRAHREIRMKRTGFTRSFSPLLIAALALVALPFVMRYSAHREIPLPWW